MGNRCDKGEGWLVCRVCREAVDSFVFKNRACSPSECQICVDCSFMAHPHFSDWCKMRFGELEAIGSSSVCQETDPQYSTVLHFNDVLYSTVWSY